MTGFKRSRLIFFAPAAAPVRLLFARAAAPVLLLSGFIAILLRLPPAESSFYPQCPIHHAFGVLCPGCGTTRALAALLHGRIHEALHLNALTVLLLPAAIGYLAAGYRRSLTGRPRHLPQPPPPAIYATLVAAAVFTIARNLWPSSF